MSIQIPDPYTQPPQLTPSTRRRLHAGWTMLGIAALTVFMSAPGQSFSVAAFVDPMLDELDLRRTNYSVAYMVATLIGGCILPFVGRLVDRVGARVVLPIVAIGLGGACGWMSSLSSAVGLYVGFTMIRCLGQGSLTLISSWIIGEWFHDFRGRAAGICAIGGTLSVMVLPQVNDLLIDGYGWRNTWLILGGSVAVCLALPAIVLLRNRPEPLGLLPDWKYGTETLNSESKSDSSTLDDIVPETEKSYTVAQAVRCSAFWKVAAVVATVSLVGTGLTFHQISILGHRGVSREFALTALGVQACAATVSTLIAGYLVDKIPERFVLAFSMLFEILALLLLLNLPSSNWVFVYSSLLGLHGGIIRSAGSIVWINYFGRRFQGSIQGVSMSLMVLAAALGPVPLALSADYTGNYETALKLFLVLPALAGIAVLSAVPPNERQDYAA